jgi:hypothetical protein
MVKSCPFDVTEYAVICVWKPTVRFGDVPEVVVFVSIQSQQKKHHRQKSTDFLDNGAQERWGVAAISGSHLAPG